MAKISKDELIAAIELMSVLELNEVVKALEEKFGVSASAMMSAPATSVQTAGSETAPVEEKVFFNVELSEAGANKIGVIKAVREINPNLGLAEAKTLVESAPKMVLGVKKEPAEEAKKKLEAAGAKVSLK